MLFAYKNCSSYTVLSSVDIVYYYEVNFHIAVTEGFVVVKRSRVGG